MKNTFYSEEIVATIRNHLNENDWQFSFDEGNGVFQFGLCLKGRLKQIQYELHVWKDEYVVIAGCPIGVDKEDKKTMANMAEFICRVNYGLKNGSFELDCTEGEIHYKSYVDCNNIVPSSEVIHNSISCPAMMLKRYGEGIIDIIFFGKTAEEAIEHCEEEKNKTIQELISKLRGEDEGLRALMDKLRADLDSCESTDETLEYNQEDSDEGNQGSLLGDFLDLLPAQRTVDYTDIPGEEPFD